MCLNHPTKQCGLRCEQCDSPVCRLCMSKEHLGHKSVALLKPFQNKKEVLHRDLQELEKYIVPKYNSIASSIQFQKAVLNKHFQKLITILNERGEVCHKEVDNLINNLKSDVDEMKHKHLAVLNIMEYEIKRTMSEIKKAKL